MKKLLISLTILICAGFFLNSCLKENKAPEPGYNVLETGSNATQLLVTPLDLYLQADRAIRFQRDSIIAKNIKQSTFSFNMGYINLTVSPADTTTFPKTITLDFGSDTSKTYTGKMIIKMNGNMRILGSKSSISYLNLVTGHSNIIGNDSIISSGINASGFIVSRYNTHSGQLSGSGSIPIYYDGRFFARYGLTSGVSVFDSVELNATANSAVYKLYSVTSPKIQIAKDCNYFNIGAVKADIKISNVLTGMIVFDYGYNSANNTNACDYEGAIYALSYLNKNYQQQYLFIAKKFQ
jgi:hypothetical protein